MRKSNADSKLLKRPKRRVIAQRYREIYEMGVVSITTIAEMAGVNRVTINNWAHKFGWVRLNITISTSQPMTIERANDIVEAFKTTLGTDIPEEGLKIARAMLSELRAVGAFEAQLVEMIEAYTQNDVTPARRNGMLAAVQLPGRAQTLQRLAAATKTLVEAEALQAGIRGARKLGKKEERALASAEAIRRPRLSALPPPKGTMKN